MPVAKKLTEDEIGELVRNEFNNFSHVSGLRIFYDMLPHFRQNEIRQYVVMLKDHPVIELGYGKSPLHRLFECGEYIGVDPFSDPLVNAKGTKIRYVKEDALTFLRKCRPSSAIVVSFGLLDNAVLGLPDKLNPRNKKLMQYREELAEMIRGVAHPFALLYGSDAEKIMGKPDIPLTPGQPIGGIYLPPLPQAA
jgi:hypothetical protein